MVDTSTGEDAAELEAAAPGFDGLPCICKCRWKSQNYSSNQSAHRLDPTELLITNL